MSWRPIASAPKDGTVVIVASQHGEKITSVRMCVWNGLGWYEVYSGAGVNYVSLWMPLPAMHGDGAEMIADERSRHIGQEGYDSDHDDRHCNGELLMASLSYLRLVIEEQAAEQSPHGSSVSRSDCEWFGWPFEKESWKPKPDAIDTLAIAGSFIAAEIDRLQRLKTN